ncbi:MAG: hypothetical protein RLP44_22220 [Aggregatilineales bacterium]
MKKAGVIIAMMSLVVLVSGFQDAPEIPIIEPESELALNMEMYDLAWHPNGHLLAVATQVGIRIFDEHLQEVDALTTDAGIFASVTWSPDGDQLAAGGQVDFPMIYVWNYDAVDQIFTVHTSFSVNNNPDRQDVVMVFLLEWSPDGTKLASQSTFLPERNPSIIGRVQIWDTTTWESNPDQVAEVLNFVRVLVWNPESTAIAVGYEGGAFAYYVDDLSSAWSVYLATDPSGVAWSSTNLVVVPGYNTLIIDGVTGQTIYAYDFTEYVYYGNAWNPDSRYLFVDVSDFDHPNNSTSGILDVTTGEIIRTFELLYRRWAMDWTQDGARIAVGTQDGIIKIWNVSDLPDQPSNLPTITPYPTDTPVPMMTPTPSGDG